jgi:ATP-binding cassette subfamily F protein uup
VSHDRRFLDNVVTQTIASEGDGVWHEYVGGYSDWLKQRNRPNPANGAGAAKPASTKSPAATPKPRTKLSFKEQRELDALPKEIEALEGEQTVLTARMSAPDYHRQGSEQRKTDGKRLEEIESLLTTKFARWEALEEQRGRVA